MGLGGIRSKVKECHKCVILFLGVELVSDRQAKQPATQLAAQVINTMKAKRVLISKIGPFDNVLKIRPPIVFSKNNADQLLDTLDEVLTELVKQGGIS